MLKNFLGLFAILCMAVGAHAGTTTSFVEVTSGVFDSGTAGQSTWAMRVVATTDWTNADLDLHLTSGSIKHLLPGFLGSPEPANGFGDTAGLGGTLVLGSLVGGQNGTAGFAGTHIETATDFETSWFTTEPDDIGTFDIAMITISDDANGKLKFRTIAGGDVENGGWTGSGTPEIFRIVAGDIVAFPEPTSLVLAGLGLIPIVLRRRS